MRENRSTKAPPAPTRGASGAWSCRRRGHRSPGTLGRALQQQVALARVARQGGGALEFGAGLVQSAQLGQQVAADAGQEVVGLERRLLRSSASTTSRPAAGPKAMETATARFSSTTGEGVSWARAS